MKATLASSVCFAVLATASFAGDKDAGKFCIENPCSFYAEAVGGGSFFVSGDLVKQFDSECEHIKGLSFDDVYGTASTYGLRFGRACDWGRIYVGFEYTEASGDAMVIGNTLVPPPDGNEPVDPTVVGRFSDYSDWGFLVGFERDLLRHRVDAKNPVFASRLRPWIGSQIGFRVVNGIDVTTSLYDDAGLLIPGSTSTSRLYDDTTVFTIAFTCGLAYDFNDKVSIGIESGLRYQTSLDGSPESDAYTADSDTLMIPLLGTVAIKF